MCLSLACLYCDTGRLDEARRELEVIASGDLTIAVGWSWASEIMNLAQLASDLGDRGLAELLYPQVLPFAAQAGMTAIRSFATAPSPIPPTCWRRASGATKRPSSISRRRSR